MHHEIYWFGSDNTLRVLSQQPHLSEATLQAPSEQQREEIPGSGPVDQECLAIVAASTSARQNR